MIEIIERLVKYEGWSVNNTNHLMNFRVGEGIIVLVSDKEINEVEIMGLEFIVNHSVGIWKGLDLDIIIANGRYNKDNDIIHNNFNNFKMNEASTKCPELTKEILTNYKSIICIIYTSSSRFNKSRWWKLCNKRKANVSNMAIDQI